MVKNDRTNFDAMSKLSHLLILLILIGCGEKKEKESVVSPRIKKETRVVSPKPNQKFKLGEVIPFEIAADVAVDSVIAEVNGVSSKFEKLAFDLPANASRVGVLRAKVTLFFEGKKETHYPKVTFLPDESPKEYTYKIVNTYPHDTKDYTQGLLIHEGVLYESSGRKGYSTLEKKNIKTGETLSQLNLSDEFFGEGLALFNNRFYQLTYTSGACFIYNKAFERERRFSYDGEGWGLCVYEDNLLMTNGSEKILIRNPDTFSVIDELQVYDADGKVDALNELEIINDRIYVNVYQESYILGVDPTTGAVLEKIDLSGLLEEVKGSQIDVLNGIAYDSDEDKIYVTGKLWPKLFELKFIPKNQS